MISGFGDQRLGPRVRGLGFRVQGLGPRVQGLGPRVQGLGFFEVPEDSTHGIISYKKSSRLSTP